MAPCDIKKAGNKYVVVRSCGEWVVVKKSDCKVLGTHSSKKGAQDQIKAIYANSPKEKWHG